MASFICNLKGLTIIIFLHLRGLLSKTDILNHQIATTDSQTEVDCNLWFMTLPLLTAVNHTIGQHSEFYWGLIETFYCPSGPQLVSQPQSLT